METAMNGDRVERGPASPASAHRGGNGTLPGSRSSVLARTLLVLVAWFLLAVWLGVTGRLTGNGTPPFALAAAIGLPLVAFAVDGRFGHPLFGGLLRLDVPGLIALQTFRVGGVVFLVAWAAGVLPGGFALPAGLGDMAIGLTAPLVAAAVSARRPHARTLVRVWNTLGVIDLLTAVSLGVLHARSSIGLLAGPVTTDAMSRYPLNLIPTFLVPLALMLHYRVWRSPSPPPATTRASAR